MRKLKNRSKFIFSIVTCVTAVTGALEGATLNWIGGTNSDLNTAANYFPASIPTSADTVTFLAGGNLFPTLTGGPVYNPGILGFNGASYTVGISNASHVVIGTAVSASGLFPQVFNVTGVGTLFEFANASADGNSTNLITYNGSSGGNFNLLGTASASTATFNLTSSTIQLLGTSTAASSTMTANTGGIIDFHISATAGTATLTANPGGVIIFSDNTTAASATINVGAGSLSFFNNSTAATSTVTVGTNGFIRFRNSATASTASLSANAGGLIIFGDTATAGSAVIGLDASFLQFFNNATAASSTATVSNNGNIVFNNSTTASTASLSANTGSQIIFGDTSTAGSAVIGLDAAILQFFTNSAAASSTLTASNGSSIQFLNSSTSTTGPVLLQGGSSLSIDHSLAFPNLNSLSSSDVIALNAASTLTIGSSSNSLIAGAIGGAGGSIIKVGTGNTTLTGINTYSGLTSVTAGTLTVNTSSLPTNTVMSNNSSLVFSQAFNGTYSQAISGSGNVRKEGTGIVTFTGLNTYNGGTTVNAGTLVLGNLLVGNAVVNSTGTLAGIGPLSGSLTVNAGGTVSPGVASIATFPINTNYINNGGNYAVDVNAAGQSDLLNVTGFSTLNGGTVVVRTIGGFSPNTRYTILSSTGGVTGTYANADTSAVGSNPLLVNAQLSYDLDHAYLTINVTSQLVAETFNQRQVAAQIDSITNPDPALAAFLAEFVSLSDAEALRALDQISGEQHTTDLLTTAYVNRQFIRRLYNPLRPIVSTINDCCSEVCSDACDDKDECKVKDECCESTVQTWFEAGGGHTQLSSDDNAAGSSINNYQVTLGAQKTFCEEWTVGIAGSYDHGCVDYDLGGTGSSSTYLGGLYGLYRPSCFYVLSDLAVGYSDNSLNRQITINETSSIANSKPKITQFTFYAEAGFDYDLNCLLIQPFVGIEIGSYWRNEITEQGAGVLDLIIEEQDHTVASSRLGVHFCSEYNAWGLTYNLDLAWQYRFSDNNEIKERFIDFGDEFTIKGVEYSRSSIDGAFTVIKKVNNCWNVYVQASAEGTDHVYTANGLAGIAFSW